PGHFKDLLGLKGADVRRGIGHRNRGRKAWEPAIIGRSSPFLFSGRARNLDDNRGGQAEESEMERDRRVYVLAPSVSAGRRALHREHGGARVIGRHDRTTIVCRHTMDEHSRERHWPVIVSRLTKAGLTVLAGPPR